MFMLVLVLRGEVHKNGKPMFLQLEDISHNEGSLQGQQLQYPEKLHHKPTSAQDCSLPPAFLFAHLHARSLSLSVAHITCKNSMDLIWTSVYSVI